MTIKRLAEITEGTVLAGEDDKEITRFYCGDFLSQVMAGAPTGCCWLTIMNNINVAGVAVIADIRAVIICEKIQPLPELKAKCAAENIALIASPLPIFECAAKIAGNI